MIYNSLGKLFLVGDLYLQVLHADEGSCMRLFVPKRCVFTIVWPCMFPSGHEPTWAGPGHGRTKCVHSENRSSQFLSFRSFQDVYDLCPGLILWLCGVVCSALFLCGGILRACQNPELMRETISWTKHSLLSLQYLAGACVFKLRAP